MSAKTQATQPAPTSAERKEVIGQGKRGGERGQRERRVMRSISPLRPFVSLVYLPFTYELLYNSPYFFIAFL